MRMLFYKASIFSWVNNATGKTWSKDFKLGLGAAMIYMTAAQLAGYLARLGATKEGRDVLKSLVSR